MVKVEQFIRELCAIGERGFTVTRVAGYVASNAVDPDSLASYLCYRPTHYTRNLIYKCDLFELIAICWDVGQESQIHNHQNQNCWMAAPIGRLAIQNYRIARGDEAGGFCELVPSDRLLMDSSHPYFVDPENPIHAVLNLPEFAERATSLHIYSRPYDHCLVYSLEAKSCRDVPLFYDSEYGRPVAATPR